MKRRGLTLIELLMALAVTVLVAVSLLAVFRSAVTFVQTDPGILADRETVAKQNAQLERLLADTYLTPDATDNKCFFVAEVLSGVSGGPDKLTFTTVGYRSDSSATVPDPNATFEDLNQKIGPQGGITEVSLSLQATGEGAQGDGLFMRVQRPSDGDITQGGTETLLISGVTSVLYEFWNGTTWVEQWDTRQSERRIPAIVRVTLGTANNPEERVLTIPLRNSDVTPTTPSTQGGTTA